MRRLLISSPWRRVLIGIPAGASLMLLACSETGDGSNSPHPDPNSDAGAADATANADAADAASDADDLPPPPPYDFAVKCAVEPCVTRIAARGGEHACVIVKDGSVRCWGSNASGQLGTGRDDAGMPEYALSPRAVAGIANATSLAATGRGHLGTTCVVSGAGDVHCFGSNASGQLGRGADASAPEAEPVVLDGLKAKSVSLTNTFALAVATDDRLWSWGTNDAEQLARSTSDPGAAPASSPARAERVAGIVNAIGGNSKTAFAVVDNDALTSWGGATTDQLARLSSLSVDPVPSPIALANVTVVATGTAHACALARGRVYCWGINDRGQLGTARKAEELLPVRVLMPSGIYAVALAAGANDTCAIDSKGDVYCWGANDGGQLGVAAGPDQASPIRVGGLTEEAVAVAVMDKAICTLQRSGAVWCRGDNLLGQLGRGARDHELHIEPGAVVFK